MRTLATIGGILFGSAVMIMLIAAVEAWEDRR